MSKEQTAESYIQDKLLQIQRENSRLDITLTTNSVLLRKRYRDMTTDDNLGLFDSYGTWTSLDSRNIYPLNIIKPMIKATTASMITADYKVNIVPRVAKNSRAEMAAEVCKSLRDLKTEQQWTSQLQEQISTEPQVASGVFLRVEWNENAPSIVPANLDEWVKEEFSEGGKAVCGSCGYEMPIDTMPEATETLDAQLMSAMDESSPRVAVLITSGEQGIQPPPEMIPIQVEEGILFVNQAKVGMEAADIEDYISRNGYAELLGKVEDNTSDTGEGAVVRTESPDGMELTSSVVKDPQNIPAQSAMDSAQFPNGQQQVLPVEDALGARLNNLSGIVCSHCGGEAQIVEEPQSGELDVISGSKAFNSGDTQTTVVPSCEILIDSKGTQGGNVKAARWMVHRYLAPMDELISEYPESDTQIRGAINLEWSFALRWQHALQTGNDVPFRDDIDTVDSLKEVKDLYMTPQMYQYVKLSQDFILGDEANPRFFVRRGENFADGIFNGEPFEKPPVLCFRTVGDQIVDVFPSDFREKFIYITFLSNPSSFWGLFLTEMLSLQDVVNYMWTVQVFHTRRNARVTKILNSGAFNPEDVEKDVVMTKETFPYDQPISNSFGVVPSATLSSEPMNLIQTVMAVKGDIGGVQPAMMGQSLPNEPYAAQRQQKEQSLGQLMPFSKSIALAKTAWTIRQLKEFKENASIEDFLFLLKLNPDWTEDYIEAFLECDLDTDVVVDYERGSESPRSLFEREMALRQFMQDIMAFAQLNPAIAKPETLNEILGQIAQFTQIGIDIDNMEAELKVADTRFEKISRIVQNFPLPPNTPPELIDMAAMQITSMPELMPSEYEDAQSAIDFYRDKINREMSMEEPNFLLVACCEKMIQLHKAAAVAEGQENMAAEMAVQAPMMQQQQQQAEQQQMQQTEQEGTMRQDERQAELENRAFDAEEREVERQHEKEMSKKAK